MSRHLAVCVAALLVLCVPAWALAGDLAGRVTDRSGGVLPGAVIRLLNIATLGEARAVADAEGRYRFPDLAPGAYVLSVGATGFSDASRSIVIDEGPAALVVDFTLDLGVLRSEVTVTAARGARDATMVPLRVDTITAETLRSIAPTSTGDALVAEPGVTPVGSGPFQVRPRLRGLDSTRVLVLVNGERLNNARTATDRAGVEVGLIDVGSIEAIEVLGGAGSVLYGTDALAGTINLITHRPRFSDTVRFDMGFDGLYSSNEDGQRANVRFGVSSRRWSVSFNGGREDWGDYRAGGRFGESSEALHASGTLRQGDTIDDAFGFSFGAFPDAFNAPFTRTSAVVPQSRMNGSSADLAARVLLAPNQDLELRYQRRRADAIGFPDFAAPFFFQEITLPWSRLDKSSVRYTVRDLTPWLRRVAASAYVQRQDRLLHNDFPVQFPAPAPTFFPITVFRLNIDSDTRQQVETPGFEVQANMQVRPDNLLTAGVSFFSDRSEDERTTRTTTSMLGSVSMGPFGSRATVFPQPVVLGPASVAHPVRVPDSTFRNLAFFVQDEWDVSRHIRLSGGLRLDAYRVATESTPGYSVDELVSGALPAIDPATLPGIDGDRITRTAVTGEAGVVLWAGEPVSVFAHYVRSYRHPNLEELLFSGPATAGNIVPNVLVEPETGHNVDVGARVHASHLSASAVYFHNRYDNFISTEIVADSPQGSISQAVNLARVRIQGIEARIDVPAIAGGLLWMPHASLAWTRGTVLEGTSPLAGTALDGEPQDNITPTKILAGLRVSDRRERWWADYTVRSQGNVSRISPLLSASPFLIAQDLFALDGFTVQRVAVGYAFRQGDDRLGVTLAVDNLTNEFYREQFQFAPARGRTVTFAVTVGGRR
ncbi:MAG TPA: TonB-dependent receptor [Vicinamibacterales bacterium]|nr:TonB-dependent receptor [Vicinamibacterales bacterium]